MAITKDDLAELCAKAQADIDVLTLGTSPGYVVVERVQGSLTELAKGLTKVEVVAFLKGYIEGEKP